MMPGGRIFRRLAHILPGWPGAGIFVVSLLLFVAGWVSLAGAAAVGTFTQVEGTVEVLRQAKPPAVPVKIRDGVDQGDQVRTKSQSRAQIRFVDDTVLTLAPGSSVLIEDYLYDDSKGTREATLNLFRGLAYTVVNNILQTEKPDFVFKTHTAVLGVRGTRFFTLVGARYSGGYIEQGEVKKMEFGVASIGEPVTKGRFSFQDLNLLKQWLVTGVPQNVLTGEVPFLSLLGPTRDQEPFSLDDLQRRRKEGMFVPPTLVPPTPRAPTPTPSPGPSPTGPTGPSPGY